MSSSRLVVPALHPSPSLSNLHIHGLNTTVSSEHDTSVPSVFPREQALESSASSIMNVDMSEGILIQDIDNDTDITEEDSIEATRSAVATNEDSKKFLREKLRRTLSGKLAHTG